MVIRVSKGILDTSNDAGRDLEAERGDGQGGDKGDEMCLSVSRYVGRSSFGVEA